MARIRFRKRTVEGYVYQASTLKDDERHNMYHMYSDGENLVATNGRSLHWCGTELPKGFYNQKGESVDWNYNFPNYRQVIPPKFNYGHTKYTITDHNEEKDEKNSTLKITIDDFGCHIIVNKINFQKAYNSLKDVVIQFNDVVSPIKLSGFLNDVECHAILMPNFRNV